MGFYINTSNMTKEEWLRQHGIRLSDSEINDKDWGDCHLVCLVNNGGFTAAGICFRPGLARSLPGSEKGVRVSYRGNEVVSVQRLNFSCEDCPSPAAFAVTRSNHKPPKGYMAGGLINSHYCRQHMPKDAAAIWEAMK